MCRSVGILFIYIKMASPLICLSLLCLGTVALANSFIWTTAKVSPVRTSWQQGLHNPECHLLGRELVNDRIEDIRVGGVTARNSLSDQYWIGAYVQYTKWIRLTGCYQTNVQGIISNLSSLSVTECYKLCGGTRFGLSNKGCVCLYSSGRVRTREYCMASPCPGHTDEFCGNDGITPLRICLCIYDVIDLPSDNKIGNCKTITFDSPGNRRPLETTNCSEEHNFVCKNYSGKLFSSTKATNWSEARFTCHEQRGQFYYGQFRKRIKKKSGSYWVSVFRKQILSWGNVTPQETEFDCLAASVSMDGTLNPFVRKCYSELPLLCDEPEKTQSTGDNNVLISANKEADQSSNAVEPEKISVLSLFIGVVCGILVTVLTLTISVNIYRCRKKVIVAQVSQNRQQEITFPETLGVHYEHLRPENRESNNYAVCGHSSVSYDFIPEQGGSGQC